MRATLLTLLGGSLLIGLCVAGIFFFASDHGSARVFAINFAVSATYTLIIGALGTVAIRWFMHRPQTMPAYAQFLVLLGAVLCAAVVGSLVASLLFVAAGLFPLALFWPKYVSGLRVALLISVMCAVGAFAYGRLRRRLDQAEKLALEARLASLESRIRPHFLFNALNTVAALIPEDPARAERTLERVTSLLRSSLDASGGLVPLRDELRLVSDYLEIESARYGERLRWSLDVDPAAEGAELPAFALQTLVENAVRHAVAPRREGGTVRVSAARRDGRLEVGVVDDGPGFSGDELPPGRGLDNLRARLAAQYGAAARLEIGPGGRVTVVVP